MKRSTLFFVVSLKVLTSPVLSPAQTNFQSRVDLVANGGRPQLQFHGATNHIYEIEVSTNLIHWGGIAQRAGSNGPVVVSDPYPGRFPARFYRAIQPDAARANGPLPQDLTSMGSDGYVADKILIKPKAGTSLGGLNLSLGISVVKVFPSFGNLQVVRVPPSTTSSALIDQYLQSGQVQYAEHDFYVHALATPNDRLYPDLWGLHNTAQFGGKANADIDAPDAWGVQHDASNIVVAVVDTGVRYTHEDLAANMWVNPADGSHGTNVVAGNNDPNDDYGHGTHVSGIIGAVGNNGIGVVGVAWHVQIMSCKFLDSEGNGTIDGAIACLEYARNHGANVINASWGATSFTSQSLHDAIAGLRDAGILFVAAAGNSGQDNEVNPVYPASYADLDNVIAVAATDPGDGLTYWSNYGLTNVDLAAPGALIYSCWDGSDTNYQSDDGTSMACAMTCGAVAILEAHFPGENYRQIKQRLLAGVDPQPSLQGKCITGGRLNLYQALTGATPPALTAGFTASPTSGQAPLTVQFTDTSTGNPVAWNWSFGDSGTSTAQNPSHVFSNAGDYTVTLTVTDGSGHTSSFEQAISATSLSTSPVITLSASQPDAYVSGGVSGTVRFHRTGDTSQSYEVNWTFSGTASNGVDYGPLPTSSPFPDGQADADLTITPINHGQTNDTTVTVTLASGPAYQDGSPNSATVTIHGVSPGASASFTASPTSGQAPLTVQFTDTSSGNPTNWDWNFGDGSSDSAAQNPSHTFNSAGTFTVRLTVTAGGQTGSASQTIMATNATTTTVAASFAASPSSGQAPLTVQFTDQSSGPVTSWSWNFGDGSSSTAQNPSHTFASAGTYTTTLTVAGSSGQSGSTSQTIIVTNAPAPVAASFAASPGSGQAPLAVQFTDQSSGPVTSWNWNFGDGQTSTAQNPSHTYDSAGTYTSTLTVTGSSGQNSSTSQTITVTNAPAPVAAGFAANPGSGTSPLTVQFTDQSSGPVVSWNWNFGDGAISTAQNPSHTYDSAGTYTSTLTVAGGSGQSGSTSATITVTNAVSSGGGGRPTVTVVATTPNASAATLAPGVFTIYRSGGDNSSAVTVIYTVGGNEQNGLDYQTLPGTATIPAGAASVNVVVQPTGNVEPGGDYPVYLMLYGYAGAPYIVGQPGSANVTIANPPPPTRPTVTVVATTPNASAITLAPGVFTIYRSGGDDSSTVSVMYTLGGNEQNGIDYQTLSGTATIPAGATSVNVVVQPTGHLEPGGNYPVYLMLYGYGGAPYIVGQAGSTSLTIANY